MAVKITIILPSPAEDLLNRFGDASRERVVVAAILAGLIELRGRTMNLSSQQWIDHPSESLVARASVEVLPDADDTITEGEAKDRYDKMMSDDFLSLIESDLK